MFYYLAEGRPAASFLPDLPLEAIPSQIPSLFLSRWDPALGPAALRLTDPRQLTGAAPDAAWLDPARLSPGPEPISSLFLSRWDPALGPAALRLTDPRQLTGAAPDAAWLDPARLSPGPEPISPPLAAAADRGLTAVNLGHPRWREALTFSAPRSEKKRVHLLAVGDVGGTLLTALKLLGGDVISTIGIRDLNEAAVARWTAELKRVHLLAVGDVGGTLLTALKLLGGDVISTIGIRDLNEAAVARWTAELGQIAWPWDYQALPEVEPVAQEDLFACDAFIFAATKAVPPVGSGVSDVRMAQYEANRPLVESFARQARAARFRGLFIVLSDPVDPLCQAAFLASNRDEGGAWDGQLVESFARQARAARFRGLFIVLSDPVDPLCQAAFLASNRDEGGAWDGQGLLPEQVQGFGLGVMNARAAWLAKQDPRFADFLTDGRAFGPHGHGLVIANSLSHYDDALSRELTELTETANLRIRDLGFKPYVAPAVSSGHGLVIANSLSHYDDALSRELTELTETANLRIRDLGFKPYVAPAVSSGAMQLLLTLRGDWHCGSVCLGGVWFGVKNRFTPQGLETESLALPEPLFARLRETEQLLHRLTEGGGGPC